MTRRRLSALALLAATLACGPAAAPDDAPLVLVSVLPQKYVAERLAGERVRVQALIPPGASPATHEPTLAQLRALGEAALYVKVGHPAFPFEAAWLERLLAEAPDLRVVDASQGLPVRGDDPHVWVAPRQLQALAHRVHDALAELLPQARAALAANQAALDADIDALDAEIRQALAPHRGRRFVVLHPAWGAFADAYGLEQVAIEHERKEPDPYELARLIRRAADAEVSVIYVQPQFNPAAAELVARELGARVEPLDPLAYDWDANLRRVTRALVHGFAE